MSATFQDFLSSLLAFESGWDRERYDAGIIQDWQLSTWAGGPVESFFPQYTSWSQLSDTEWKTMAYQSTNSYGFVGYQFGEALLIDLGYYDDDFYYGNGAATNTWDGAWTGKNGVDSLEEFMTAEAQDVAIQEAFGHNLGIIEAGLAAAGKSLDDYVGTTQTYTVGGQSVSIEMTLTGLLAGAHLRGAPAVVSLLLNGTLSSDEYGTSILQYIEQFGGYDAPSSDDLIAYFEDRLTGDEGLGTPGDPGSSGPSGSGNNGSAGVTADTADVVITWAWGQNKVVDFDPDSDTIFVDWFHVGELQISETAVGVVFAIPGNNQTVTLAGVALTDLSPANFTVQDSGLGAAILSLVGAETSGEGETGGDTGEDTGGDAGDETGGEGGSGDGDSGTPVVGDGDGHGTANVTRASADVVITWAWGQNKVVDFDPDTDTIFVDWFHVGEVTLTETASGVVIVAPGNNQSTTLAGVTLAELSPANFTVMDSALGSSVFDIIGSGSEGDRDTDPGGDDVGTDSPLMVMITLTSASMTVDDFDPSKDMIHIEQGITDDLLLIAEAGGNTTITITQSNGSPISTVTLTGITLADLDIGNFSIAEQSALNEVASVLGESIAEPAGTEGKAIVYDSDGSDPPPVIGTTAEGGTIYQADYFADDIVGFNPAVDRIDFGDTSVHNMILTKAPTGEAIIDNPWWLDQQILQGVDIADLSIESFGVVANEHLRQDIGGVMSWELGVGPREDDTVYIRSHEYGVTTVIDDFDPATMKISFLYYGTRERLSVEDTDNGLVISTYPSGETFVFTGLSLSDLKPGNVEFHHDQVVEDNLEAAFGFSQDDVTLVSRTELLTPEAPAGQATDGYQTRVGVGASGSDDGTIDDGTDDGSGGDGIGGDGGDTGAGGGAAPDGQVDTFHFGWNWAAVEVISGFAAAEDVIDFGALPANLVKVTESDGDLVFEILDNGGHAYVVEDIQAEDLTAANLSAPNWSNVLTKGGGVYDQLAALGADDLI